MELASRLYRTRWEPGKHRAERKDGEITLP